MTAVVKVVLRDGTFHEDVGYGISDNKNKGEAIEKAKKEAVSDARKRALRLFGNALGNSVYDREYTSIMSKAPKSTGRAGMSFDSMRSSLQEQESAKAALPNPGPPPQPQQPQHHPQAQPTAGMTRPNLAQIPPKGPGPTAPAKVPASYPPRPVPTPPMASRPKTPQARQAPPVTPGDAAARAPQMQYPPAPAPEADQFAISEDERTCCVESRKQRRFAFSNLICTVRGTENALASAMDGFDIPSAQQQYAEDAGYIQFAVADTDQDVYSYARDPEQPPPSKYRRLQGGV